MYYQQGDYYRGDYYRGDPGILGAIGRVLGGAALGLVRTRSPLGAIAGAVGGAVAATRRNLGEAVLSAGDQGSAYTPAMRARHAEIVARGGSGLVRGGSIELMRLGPGPQPHYVPGVGMVSVGRRGGGAAPMIGPDGMMMRRRRRMRVTNPKALRRAIRRVSGFGKLVHRMKRAVAKANTAVGNVRRGGRKTVARRR